MRYWNSGDEALLQALQTAFADVDSDVEFVAGAEGGVAVYRGATFFGVWVEFQRGRFSFIPAAYLEPTLINFSADQATSATCSILSFAHGSLPLERKLTA